MKGMAVHHLNLSAVVKWTVSKRLCQVSMLAYLWSLHPQIRNSESMASPGYKARLCLQSPLSITHPCQFLEVVALVQLNG